LASQSPAGFAYPAAAYPINPASLAQQPPGFVPSSVLQCVYVPPSIVQYGDSAPPSAHQFRYTANGLPAIVPLNEFAQPSEIRDTEAELPPTLGFAGGVPGLEDSYGHPAYSANTMSQTSQNQDHQYGPPGYDPSFASNPVTTFPTTAHRRNKEAEVSLYSHPVNIGTDVRLIDPETINSGTQLERRVQLIPSSLGPYAPQPDTPWTNTLTYDASPTRQQPIPSSAPGSNTQQSVPSIGRYLLGPVAYPNAAGVVEMTGHEYFGSSQRIQGSKNKRRKNQDG